MFPSKRAESNSRLRRRDKNDIELLYKPSIFTYTCYGFYYAASDGAAGSEGACKGFKSNLDMIYDKNQETVSRADALRKFASIAADFEDLPEYARYDNSELQQQTKAVLLSPTLIFNDKNLSPKGDRLPEEELIKRQTWSCYGSTEVEYLVLQDVNSGDKKIAAVAPRNTGVSVREIETEDSLRSITRIGLGWLDIIHDRNSTFVDADSVPRIPDDVAPTPSQDMLESAKQTLHRTYDFSGMVASHMQSNLLWLGNNLRDDFPQRVYSKGRQIVAQFPKTLDQTLSNMGKIVGRMLNDDDDDDRQN